MELQQVTEKTLKQAQTAGSEKTMVVVTSTMAKEFNIEANRLTLLRTTFDQSLNIKSWLDQRQASSSGNQFSDEAIASLSAESMNAAKSAPQDEGNGFAPNQGQRQFQFGKTPINEEWMYSRLNELLKEREKQFPKIILDTSYIKYIQQSSVLATSEGTLLRDQQGSYQGFVFFSAKEGRQSSSFNYTTFSIGADGASPTLSLMQTSSLQELLGQLSEQIHVKKVPTKFDGEIIVTPHCLADFLWRWGNYLGPERMLKKSSFFQDKLGQKVASPLWTLTANPVDSAFATQLNWTADGYLAENETLIEKGVLKNYLLNHYAATKLGQKVSRSQGEFLRLSPGSSSLKDMIGSVKKGVLMCRYSAGNPAENGDISGVAKNSYYIENGEIQYPLGETMVSANLARMLMDVQDISKESMNNGYWDLPWVRFAGVTVS